MQRRVALLGHVVFTALYMHPYYCPEPSTSTLRPPARDWIGPSVKKCAIIRNIPAKHHHQKAYPLATTPNMLLCRRSVCCCTCLRTIEHEQAQQSTTERRGKARPQPRVTTLSISIMHHAAEPQNTKIQSNTKKSDTCVV